MCVFFWIFLTPPIFFSMLFFATLSFLPQFPSETEVCFCIFFWWTNCSFIQNDNISPLDVEIFLSPLQQIRIIRRGPYPRKGSTSQHLFPACSSWPPNRVHWNKVMQLGEAELDRNTFRYEALNFSEKGLKCPAKRCFWGFFFWCFISGFRLDKWYNPAGFLIQFSGHQPHSAGHFWQFQPTYRQLLSCSVWVKKPSSYPPMPSDWTCPTTTPWSDEAFFWMWCVPNVRQQLCELTIKVAR